MSEEAKTLRWRLWQRRLQPPWNALVRQRERAAFVGLLVDTQLTTPRTVPTPEGFFVVRRDLGALGLKGHEESDATVGVQVCGGMRDPTLE